MIGMMLRAGFVCGLLALLGWSGLAAWHVIMRSPSTVAVSSEQPSQSTTPRDVALVRPPLAAFPETLNRPLFFEGRVFPERRPEPVAAPGTPQQPSRLPPTPQSPAVIATPVVPQATVAPSVTPPKPSIVTEVAKPATTDGIKLLGVLVNKGRARALIEAQPQTSEWLSVGSKVRGWTIESISADRVALRLGKQMATLELYSLSTASPPSRLR